jgi:hypothetical protein
MLTTSPNPILCPKVRTIRPDGFTAPHVLRTKAPTEKRRLIRLFRQQTARDFVGILTPGCHLYGLSKGQFSLLDILRALSDQTGPAALTLSTWTAARADVSELATLTTENRFTSTRFLLDFSFQRREPALIAALRSRYGNGSVVMTRNHAKFILLHNARWNVVCRTSMNLNHNPRLEDVMIEDNPELHQFLDHIFHEIFATYANAHQEAQKPGQLHAAFDSLTL